MERTNFHTQKKENKLEGDTHKVYKIGPSEVRATSGANLGRPLS